MTKTRLPPSGEMPAGLEKSLAQGEKDLDILDAHAAELSAVEKETQLEMKRRDRELKDAHLHSIPKPIKHTRP